MFFLSGMVSGAAAAPNPHRKDSSGTDFRAPGRKGELEAGFLLGCRPLLNLSD